MANIPVALVSTGQEGRNRLYKWTGITDADVCLPLNVYGSSDLTFEIAGTIGAPAAVVALQGCMQPDVVESSRTYTTLQRGDGITALSFSALGVFEVLQIPIFVKPLVTVGTAESVNVYVKVGYRY